MNNLDLDGFKSLRSVKANYEYSLIFSIGMYVCVRGGPNQPLHRDLQWSIVLFSIGK
jgi:Na+/H+ antiporter NhaD/arsenite permease-like protein